MSSRRPVLVLVRQSELDEAQVELLAILKEDLAHASELLRLTRSIAVGAATGRDRGNDIVELERLIHRLSYQRRSALVAIEAAEVCLDGAEAGDLAHGQAA